MLKIVILMKFLIFQLECGVEWRSLRKIRTSHFVYLMLKKQIVFSAFSALSAFSAFLGPTIYQFEKHPKSTSLDLLKMLKMLKKLKMLKMLKNIDSNSQHIPTS